MWLETPKRGEDGDHSMYTADYQKELRERQSARRSYEYLPALTRNPRKEALRDPWKKCSYDVLSRVKICNPSSRLSCQRESRVAVDFLEIPFKVEFAGSSGLMLQ